MRRARGAYPEGCDVRVVENNRRRCRRRGEEGSADAAAAAATENDTEAKRHRH